VRSSLEDVLEKAAQLQELVPAAVLVGGTAAALHAHHRESLDHDHVVADLAERFDAILQNLEALGDWSMTRAQPGKIILGELGGIETGVRQLLRGRPLETTEIEVRGKRLVVPTATEILRIKAWLALSHNQTRDYLDIAALAEQIGLDDAAAALQGIDDYYADINTRPEAVVTQLVKQLADPRPRDAEVTTQLASYKALDPRWHDWSTVKTVLADLAERMTR
jgi:Nucleotidyl transferase AbiEii toxin, Type IV TA system